MAITVNVAQFVGQENVAASCVEVYIEGLRGCTNSDLSVPKGIAIIYERVMASRALVKRMRIWFGRLVVTGGPILGGRSIKTMTTAGVTGVGFEALVNFTEQNS